MRANDSLDVFYVNFDSVSRLLWDSDNTGLNLSLDNHMKHYIPDIFSVS